MAFAEIKLYKRVHHFVDIQANGSVAEHGNTTHRSKEYIVFIMCKPKRAHTFQAVYKTVSIHNVQ